LSGFGLSRQTEIGDHGPHGSVDPSRQDDVVALEVPVNHFIAVRFSQARTELLCDRASFRIRKPRAEALGERFTFEKLHGYKVDLAFLC